MDVIKIDFLNKEKNNKWEKIKIEYWNPEPGDKIEGKIEEKIQTNDRKIYTIKTRDKRIKIWGTTYLDQLMEEIEINDYIRITYNGLKQTYKNRQMKRYNIERRIE